MLTYDDDDYVYDDDDNEGNVSVNSKLQHAPLLFKFPPTRAKMPFKCPTLGSIQVTKCPHPGDISQAQK